MQTLPKTKLYYMATKAVRRNEALRERVSILEEKIASLQYHVKILQQNADTIDAGNAMKIIVEHLVSFVLPENAKIAELDAISQMLEYVKENEVWAWEFLRNQCKISWNKLHSETIKRFVKDRNEKTHHEKFDLALIEEAMINLMPHRKEYIKDLIALFVKVNSLLKFGTLASELVDRANVSLEHNNTLLEIQRGCYRNVRCLQDIDIEEAKKHLIEYCLDRKIPLPDDITKVIKNTNRPRLVKLLRENESRIVSSILQQPAILTFDQLNVMLKKGKRSRAKEAELWNTLLGYKEWTQDHSVAIMQLKKLASDNEYETVDAAPVYIAKLHVPDFLDKELWMAGSDIFEIFGRWRTEKGKNSS